MDTSTQSIQVRSREPRRRFRTVEEKRRIVEETLRPGASVARVALAHEVNANQLFGWRRQYLQGQLQPRENAGLLAVGVMREARETARANHGSTVSSTIQIELPRGTIRVVGIVDPASLQTVLEYLTR
jgi:transposase